jgi:hypothetical protein
MLLNFPRCLSILLLQTSKTDNNALDIDAIYNLKLRKTKPNSTDSFTTTKLNAKFPWPPIMPKQRECILDQIKTTEIESKYLGNFVAKRQNLAT